MANKKEQHHSKVDEALNLTEGKGFEEDLQALLKSENDEEYDNVIIVLVDLDNFMRVNNDFGYDEGDRVLIETGKHLQRYVGEQGTLYRVGGDEFGLIFKGDMEKEEVFLLMEDMRKNYNITLPNDDAMTISIGIATAFENATRYQELFRMAESALFRAKFSGRNKVALAKEEKMVPKTSHYTQDQLKRLNILSKREGIGEAILLREAMDMLLKKYDV